MCARAYPRGAPASGHAVSQIERLTIDQLGYEDDGISRLTANFGFQNPIDVPSLLVLAVAPTPAPGIRTWRERL